MPSCRAAASAAFSRGTRTPAWLVAVLQSAECGRVAATAAHKHTTASEQLQLHEGECGAEFEHELKLEHEHDFIVGLLKFELMLKLNLRAH